MNPDYHIVSFSGGKDSTALLLGMIDRNMRIDEVINFDTGLEFPYMYDHINRIKTILDEKKIKFSTFKSKKGFEWFLLDKERLTKANMPMSGWGWPNINNRWCTAYLKTRNSDAYLKELRERYEVIQYIGIASDESKRMERKHHQNKEYRYPLIEWGMTEQDCLNFCYDRGYDWGGLYNLFNRVSCWCCPFQPLKELYKLWINFPDLWAQLKTWDSKLIHEHGTNAVLFKKPYNVEQLEKRFTVEKRRKDLNLSVCSKNFYKEINIACNGVKNNQRTLEEFAYILNKMEEEVE